MLPGPVRDIVVGFAQVRRIAAEADTVADEAGRRTASVMAGKHADQNRQDDPDQPSSKRIAAPSAAVALDLRSDSSVAGRRNDALQGAGGNDRRRRRQQRSHRFLRPDLIRLVSRIFPVAA
jgi:hypothetical protein